MQRESLKEELIVRYLLGDLPDEEQIQLEDRAFADHQYMENIMAVEDDLIDSYLKGSLPERQRSQFESRFLASNERRRKIEFARALAEVSSRRAVTEFADRPMTSKSLWESFVALFRNLSPVLSFSLAAASLAAVVGVTWLVGHTITQRREVKQLELAKRTEPTPQPSPEPQLARNQPAPTQATPPAPVPPQPAPPTLASLVLLPGISRSAGARPRLVIPQTAQSARIQVGLERTDDYRSFRVELRNSEDQEVLTRGGLHPQTSRAGRVINLVIPRSILRNGQYELTLKGSVDDQKTEDVRYYYFDVQRQ